MFKKSQTATEYLVILAIVIVIALVVVGVMGGIPSIGGGVSRSVSQITSASGNIAVENFAVSDYDTDLILKNNYNKRVRVDSISINGQNCDFGDGVTYTIDIGGKKTITCEDLYEPSSDKVSWSVEINWTDLSTSSSYTESGDDFTLVTSVSNEYLSTLQSNQYWNTTSNDGCFDAAQDPIPLCTCVDLNKVRDDLTADYALQNDIDFIRCRDKLGADYRSGSGWEPIPWDRAIATGDRFSGSFDGNSHVIKHLFSDRSGEVGLFADVGGTISNLGMLDVDLTVGSYGGAGGIASYIASTGSLTNSYVTGVVKGGNYLGGLVGVVGGPISNSYSEATVSGSSSVGGLTGYSAGGSITNSYSTGTITCTGSDCGGLVGTPSLTITSSYG